MQRYKLDALIATSRTNVTYFSDFAFWSEALPREYMTRPGGSDQPSLQFFAVLPQQAPAALVVPLVCASQAQTSWIKDIYAFGRSNLYDPPLATGLAKEHPHVRAIFPADPNSNAIETLARVLCERGLDTARIGIELQGLRPEFQARLKTLLPNAASLDCSNLLRLLRMVKGRDELARLTRAAEIGERAGMAVFASASPGQRLDELARRFAARVADEGAEFDHLTIGTYGWGISDAPDFTFAADDVVFADWGCIYSHMFSDTGTTLVLGELEPRMQAKYQALRACIEGGAACMKPGVQSSAVHAAMFEALASNGLSHLAPQGHSLGLEFKEYPIIAPRNDLMIRDDCVAESSDLPLEAGMVINLEVPLFMPGIASLHSEQSFLITASGCELLTAQDRRRPFSPDRSNSGAFEREGRTLPLRVG
jgi:Xaa-Pro aminopeptidase